MPMYFVGNDGNRISRDLTTEEIRTLRDELQSGIRESRSFNGSTIDRFKNSRAGTSGPQFMKTVRYEGFKS